MIADLFEATKILYCYQYFFKRATMNDLLIMAYVIFQATARKRLELTIQKSIKDWKFFLKTFSCFLLSFLMRGKTLWLDLLKTYQIFFTHQFKYRFFFVF